MGEKVMLPEDAPKGLKPLALGKEKPTDVKIIQLNAVPQANAMGGVGLVILGLGDDDGVWCWHPGERKWREN